MYLLRYSKRKDKKYEIILYSDNGVINQYTLEQKVMRITPFIKITLERKIILKDIR